MSVSYVQGNSNTGAGVDAIDAAFPSANTAGNFIIVCIGAWNHTVGTPTVSDSAGNTYALIKTATCTDAGGSVVSVWYAANVNAGANTVTVTGVTSGSDMDIIIAEYSGPATIVPVTTSAVVVESDAGSVEVSIVSPGLSESDALLLYSYDQTNSGDSFSFYPSGMFTTRETTSNTAGGESSALADAFGAFTGTKTPSVVNGGPISNGIYLVAILLTSSGTDVFANAQTQFTLPGAWEVTNTAQTIESGFEWNTPPFTYAVDGTLPTGLALSSDGTLTGAPNTAGNYTFTIIATDANGKTGRVLIAASITSANVPVNPWVCAAVLYGWTG